MPGTHSLNSCRGPGWFSGAKLVRRPSRLHIRCAALNFALRDRGF